MTLSKGVPTCLLSQQGCLFNGLVFWLA